MIEAKVDDCGRCDYFHDPGRYGSKLTEGREYKGKDGSIYRVVKIYSAIQTPGFGANNYVYVDLEPVA